MKNFETFFDFVIGFVVDAIVENDFNIVFIIDDFPDHINRPLKIFRCCFPAINFLASAHRLKWCRNTLFIKNPADFCFGITLISTLGLSSVETVHGRAEDYAKPDRLREKFDLCVSRAVANMTTLSEFCLPFVKVGGMFISYKSEKITEEMKQAEKAIAILGGKVKSQTEIYLPDSDIYRDLFAIEKVAACPKKYPRKAGLPAKEPLH